MTEHIPPKETRMFQHVPMQAIADLLKTMPIPITITQYLDEQKEQLYYSYQVGTPTEENPIGLRRGATPHFLEAVQRSLEGIMVRQRELGNTGQVANTRPENQAPADVWIVPEVERGECSAEQAAALGLPYRHRLTGETIAEWTERTRHDHLDTTSQEGGMGEQQEQELTTMLRNLPIAVNIWKRDDGYIWQCFEQSGIAEDFAGSVGEGLHAMLGQLMQDRQSNRKTFHTFGEILYQTDDGYTERVIADTSTGRVVMCEQHGSIKLYRIEWTEQDGYERSSAVYTLHDAMSAFQALSHSEQQG